MYTKRILQFVYFLYFQKIILCEILQQCSVSTYSSDSSQSGSYTSTCQACDSSCSSCFNETQCTQCKYSLVTSSAEPSYCTKQQNVCPDGFYLNTTLQQCTQCDIPFCKACTDKSTCVTCQDNFVLTSQFVCVFSTFYSTKTKQVIEDESFIVQGKFNQRSSQLQKVNSCPHPTITDFDNRICKQLETCSSLQQNLEFCLNKDITKIIFTESKSEGVRQIIVVTQKEAILLDESTLSKTYIIAQLLDTNMVIQDSFVHREVLHLITSQNILLYSINTGLLLQIVSYNQSVEDSFWMNKIETREDFNIINQYSLSNQEQSQITLSIFRWQEADLAQGKPYQLQFLHKVTLYQSTIKIIQIEFIQNPDLGITTIVASTVPFLIAIELKSDDFFKSVLNIFNTSTNPQSKVQLLVVDPYMKILSQKFPLLGYLVSNDLFFVEQQMTQLIIVRSAMYSSIIFEIETNKLTILQQSLYQYSSSEDTIQYYKFYIDPYQQYLISTLQSEFKVSAGNINTLFISSNQVKFGIADSYLIHAQYQSVFSSIQWNILTISNQSQQIYYLIGYYNLQLLIFNTAVNNPIGNLPFKIISIDNDLQIWQSVSTSTGMIGQNGALLYYQNKSIWYLKDLQQISSGDLKYTIMIQQDLECKTTRDNIILFRDSAIQMIEKYDAHLNLLIQVQHYTQKRSGADGFSISLIHKPTDEIINYTFKAYSKAVIVMYNTVKHFNLTKYAMRNVLIDSINHFICILYENDALVYQYPTLELVQQLTYTSFIQSIDSVQTQIIVIVTTINKKLVYQAYEFRNGQLLFLDFINYSYDGRSQFGTINYFQSAFIWSKQYIYSGGQIVNRIVSIYNQPGATTWAIDFYEDSKFLQTNSIIVDQFIDGDFLDESTFAILVNGEMRVLSFISQQSFSDPSSLTITAQSYPNQTDLFPACKLAKLLANLKMAVWSYYPTDSPLSIKVFDFTTQQFSSFIPPQPPTGLFVDYVNMSRDGKKVFIFYEAQQTIADNAEVVQVGQFNETSRLFEFYQSTQQIMEDFNIVNDEVPFDSYYSFQRQIDASITYFFDTSNNNNRYLFNLKSETNIEPFPYRFNQIHSITIERERINRLFFQFDYKMMNIRRLPDKSIDAPVSTNAFVTTLRVVTTQIFQNFPIVLLRETYNTTHHRLHLLSQDQLQPLFTENGWPMFVGIYSNTDIAYWSDIFELLVVYTSGCFRVYSPSNGFKQVYQSQNLASLADNEFKIQLTYQPYIIISYAGMYNYISNTFHSMENINGFVYNPATSPTVFVVDGKQFLVIGPIKKLLCFDISFVKYPSLSTSDIDNTKSSMDPSFSPTLLSTTNLKSAFFLDLFTNIQISVDNNFGVVYDRQNSATLWIQIPQMLSIKLMLYTNCNYNPVSDLLITFDTQGTTGYQLIRYDEGTSNSVQNGSYMRQLFQFKDTYSWTKTIGNLVFFDQNVNKVRQYLIFNSLTGEQYKFDSLRTGRDCAILYVWYEKEIFITSDPAIISYGDINYVYIRDSNVFNTGYTGISHNFNYLYYFVDNKQTFSRIDASDLFPINKLRSSISNNYIVKRQNSYFNQTAIYFNNRSVFIQTSRRLSQKGQVDNKPIKIFTFEKVNKDVSTQVKSYNLQIIDSQNQIFSLATECQITIFSSSLILNNQIIDPSNQSSSSQTNYQSYNLMNSNCNIISSKTHQTLNLLSRQQTNASTSFYFHVTKDSKLFCLRVSKSNEQKGQNVTTFLTENVQIVQLSNASKFTLLGAYKSLAGVSQEQTPSTQYLLLSQIDYSVQSNNEIKQNVSYLVVSVDKNLQVASQQILDGITKGSEHLFFSSQNMDYLVIGTTASTLRLYSLNSSTTYPELKLNSGVISQLIYVPEQTASVDNIRIIVLSSKRIHLIMGLKSQQSDTPLSSFNIVPNVFMITHTRFNCRAAMLNYDVLAVYNYNQINVFRIGSSSIQFIGRIEEKFFKYISQVKITSDNNLIVVSDLESIHVFRMFYTQTTSSSWIPITSRKLPLVFTYANVTVPYINEIANFKPEFQMENKDSFGIYQIYGSSSKGLISFTINSNTFTDNNSKYSISSQTPNVTDSNTSCLKTLSNSQTVLQEQKQQLQVLLSSSKTQPLKYFSIQLNNNNSQYVLPLFSENLSLYNKTKNLAVMLDLQGNSVELIQPYRAANKNGVTDIQISNGTLVLTKDNQIYLQNLNSVIFKDIQIKIDDSFQNITTLQRNQIEIGNTTHVLFDSVILKNQNLSVVVINQMSLQYSFVNFTNVSEVSLTNVNIFNSSILNQNMINFDQCSKVNLNQINITQSNISNRIFMFNEINQNIKISNLIVKDSGINSLIGVSKSTMFTLQNSTFQGIYGIRQKLSFLDTQNQEVIEYFRRNLLTSSIEDYLNDFYSEQNGVDFGGTSRDVLIKLNLMKDISIFQNIKILSSNCSSFLNLKSYLAIYQNSASSSTTQNLISNKSAFVFKGLKVEKSHFKEYLMFINENKMLLSDVNVNSSDNPSIILENAYNQKSFSDTQSLYFVDEYLKYGISISKFVSSANTYFEFPLIAIQNSIVLLSDSEIYINKIKSDLFYPIDLSYIIFKINNTLIRDNECQTHFVKISNSQKILNLATDQKKELTNQLISVTILNQRAGGLYISNSEYIVEIQSCIFKNNIQAQKGGALRLQSVLNTTLFNSTFENNNALFTGGAIYLEESDLVILKLTNITKNTAPIGGGIRYNNTLIYPHFMQFINQVRNQILSNTAEIYADNYGSNINEIKLMNELRNVTSSLNQQQVNITFQLFGEDGQVVKINNFINIISKSQSFQMDQLFQQFQQNIFFMIRTTESDDSRTSPLIFTSSNISSIVEGTSQLQFTLNIIDSISSDRESSIEIVSSTSNFISNSASKQMEYQQIKYIVPIQFRNCQSGEVIKYYDQYHYYCFSCDSNTYSLALPDMTNLKKKQSTESCKECPPGVKYCNGAELELMEGYWRDPGSDFIAECVNAPDKCTSVNSKYGCSEGAMGPMCESCDYNHDIWDESRSVTFVKKNKYNCAKCYEADYVFNLYSIPIVAGLIFFLYLTIRILKEHKLKIEKLKVMYLRKIELITCSNMLYETEKSTILLKFIIGHFQLLSLITIMPLPLPQSFVSGFFFMGNYLESTYYSIDCQLIGWGFSKSVPMVYLRLLWNSITIPLIYLNGLLLLFFVLYLRVKKKLKGTAPQRFDSLVISGVLKLYYMIYPGIISQAIKSITCRNINGMQYLIEDVQYQCYDQNYYIFNFLISYPLIIAMIVIPMMVLKRLYRNRTRLHKIKTYLDYSFYYSEYRSSSFYWEFVKIYLRIFLYLCLNIFNQYPVIFGIIFSIAIIIYIRYQQRIKPYRFKLFNYLDNLSLTTCFFTIQLFILVTQKYKVFSSQLPVTIICLFMIVFMNLYTFYQFFQAIVDHTLQSTRKTPFQSCLVYMSQKMPCLFGDIRVQPFNFARMNKNWTNLKKSIRSTYFKKLQEEYFSKLKFLTSSSIASKSTATTTILPTNRITTFNTMTDIKNDLHLRSSLRIQEIQEEDEEINNIEMSSAAEKQKRKKQLNTTLQNFQENNSINIYHDIKYSSQSSNLEAQPSSSLKTDNDELLSYKQPMNGEEYGLSGRVQTLTLRTETYSARELITEPNQLDTQVSLEENTPTQNNFKYLDNPLKYKSKKISSKDSIN